MLTLRSVRKAAVGVAGAGLVIGALLFGGTPAAHATPTPGPGTTSGQSGPHRAPDVPLNPGGGHGGGGGGHGWGGPGGPGGGWAGHGGWNGSGGHGGWGGPGGWGGHPGWGNGGWGPPGQGYRPWWNWWW